MPLVRPYWRPIRHIDRAELPPGLRTLLCEQRSLTRRLKRCCGSEFRLELKDQSWARPFRDEALCLGLNPSVLALIRQVYLYCGAKPLVYARTVIPAVTLHGGARQLAFLGSRPLGDVLFADKTACRQNLTVAQIPADDKRFELATGEDWVGLRALWARRSLFHFRDKPLLVVEIFLCEPPPISRRAYCR